MSGWKAACRSGARGGSGAESDISTIGRFRPTGYRASGLPGAPARPRARLAGLPPARRGGRRSGRARGASPAASAGSIGSATSLRSWASKKPGSRMPLAGRPAARQLAGQELLARLDHIVVEPERRPDHLPAQAVDAEGMRLEVAAVAVHRAERRGEAEGVRVAADRGAGRGAQDRLEVVVGQERPLGPAGEALDHRPRPGREVARGAVERPVDRHRADAGIGAEARQEPRQRAGEGARGRQQELVGVDEGDPVGRGGVPARGSPGRPAAAAAPRAGRGRAGSARSPPHRAPRAARRCRRSSRCRR